MTWNFASAVQLLYKTVLVLFLLAQPRILSTMYFCYIIAFFVVFVPNLSTIKILLSALNNGNPFLDDRLSVWQQDRSHGSAGSSPEPGQDQHYTYRRVPEAPSTPELQELRQSNNYNSYRSAFQQAIKDLHRLDFFRSTASAQSSAPPTPVLIQVGRWSKILQYS